MTDFAAIDFETANEYPSSVCSVGIVVVRGGEIVDRFYSLIHPEPEYYRRFCRRIHGLGPEDTEDAPVFPYVWKKVEPLIEGLPLVAHNSPFDEECLKQVFRVYQMDYPDYVFCDTLCENTGRPHPDDKPYQKFVSCYIDEINAPLYPFGYGLSYTTYAYSPVTLSASGMPMDGSVTASVTVTNTGSRAGDEIVQLYIHDIYATSTRPVKELKGFRKVHLEPGASTQVEFTLTKEELSYYNHDLQWVCEPGEFEIMIGPNSRDTGGVTLRVQ